MVTDIYRNFQGDQVTFSYSVHNPSVGGFMYVLIIDEATNLSITSIEEYVDNLGADDRNVFFYFIFFFV